MSETGWESLEKVQEESGEPRGGQKRVGGVSGRSGTGRWSLEVVRDRSEASERSGMGRGSQGEV